MNEHQDMFEVSVEEKKALAKKRLFLLLFALNVIMVILIIWEIIEMFL